MIRRCRKHESGHAMLVAIAVTVLLSLGAIVALTLAFIARDQAAVAAHGDDAYWIAHDGVERSIAALKRDGHWRDATAVAAGGGWRPWSRDGLPEGLEVRTAPETDCPGARCLWVRAAGRARKAARRVEALVARLLPEDFAVFAGGSIRGPLAIEGGAYAGGCEDVAGACTAIDIGAGGIRATAPAWVVAHGAIRGSPFARVGETGMPLTGILAPSHDVDAEKTFIGRRWHDPPWIAMPETAPLVAAARAARTHLDVAFVCDEPAGCGPHAGTARGWRRVDWPASDAILNLVPPSRVLIPAAGVGIDCTLTTDAAACDGVAAHDPRFAMTFHGDRDPAVLAASGTAVVVAARVVIRGDVVYERGFELIVDHHDGLSIDGRLRARCPAPRCTSPMWLVSTGRVDVVGAGAVLEAAAFAAGELRAVGTDQRWRGGYIAARVRADGATIIASDADAWAGRSPGLRAASARAAGGMVILRWREPYAR